MSTNTQSKPRSIKERGCELLAFAHKQLDHGGSGVDLFLALFGSRGKARMLFPTRKEWLAFERSEENKELQKLIENLPTSHQRALNGDFAVTLHLPKSLHSALIKEAAAEGVSLDQLCLSKLVAQLRELV